MQLTMNDKAKQFLRRAHGDVGSLRCHENEKVRRKARRERAMNDGKTEVRQCCLITTVSLCVWKNTVVVVNR
jgi:hypothetical protein